MTRSTTHLEGHPEKITFSLTPDQAQKEILRKHDTEYLWVIGGWKKKDPILGELPFYFWIYEKYPELLDFPDSGDRYQTIASWVISSTYLH